MADVVTFGAVWGPAVVISLAAFAAARAVRPASVRRGRYRRGRREEATET